MLKRGGNLTRTRAAKIKKRRGVGSRSITVLDSDEEDLAPKVSTEYARVTKARVAASGKVERIATNSVQIFEADEIDVQGPQETDTDNFVGATTENVVRTVPAKKRRKGANDSVSYPAS